MPKKKVGIGDDDTREFVDNPGDGQNSQSNTENEWRALFAFTTRSQLPVVLPALLCSLLAGAMQPAMAIFLGRFFNSFSEYGSRKIEPDELVRRSLVDVYGLIAIGVVTWLLKGSLFSLWVVNGEMQAKSARDLLFEHLLRRDLTWYDLQVHGIGSVVTRLQTHIRELQSGTSQTLGSVFTSITQAVVSIVVAIYYDWRLSLVILSFAPAIALAIALIQTGMGVAVNGQKCALDNAATISRNAIANIVLVKCSNAQDVERTRYETRSLSAATHYLDQAHVNALEIAVSSFTSHVVALTGMLYGVILIHQGNSTTTKVLTAFWSCLAVASALDGILPQLLVLEKSRSAANAIKQILSHVNHGSRICEPSGVTCRGTFDGDIEIQGVSFSYPSRPDQLILQNSSFFFPAGEITFLIGRSGSGKSTVGSLLLRFYEPNAGRILADGLDIQCLDIAWLRNNITLVQQQPTLFNETIHRNIVLGCHDHKDVSEEQVFLSIDFSMLSQVVASLPDGIHTQAGFGGSKLSGGQRQRVALARARLRDTPILILDESTSALDLTNRSAIMKKLREWRRGKTTIVITHDLAQVEVKDFVYVLERGRIVTEGYQAALTMWPAQALSADRTPGLKHDERETHNHEFGRLNPNDESISVLHNDQCDSLDDDSCTSSRRGPLVSSLEATGSHILHSGRPLSHRFSNSGRVLLEEQSSQRRSPKHLLSKDARRSSTLQSRVIPYKTRLSRPMSMHHALVKRSINNPTTIIRTVQTGELSKVALAAIPMSINVEVPNLPNNGNHPQPHSSQLPTLLAISRTILPTLSLSSRNKFSLHCGFAAATVHAACPALVSYFLTKLLTLFYIQTGWQDGMKVNSLAISVIAIMDGLSCYFMHYLLEFVGQKWIDHLRVQAMRRVIEQPQAWFDDITNQPASICSTLDRDAEEARNLLGRFAASIYIVAVMMMVGIGWALFECWKLTLAGVASAPILYLITIGFNHVSSICEARTNEEGGKISAIFAETFSDIRTVRALTLESYFHKKYTRATSRALGAGVRRALYSGFFFGLSDSAIVFVIAALFAYGTLLAKSGSYSVETILTVFSLLLFCSANANAIVAFIPQISSSVDTASRLIRLSQLALDSHEASGLLQISDSDPGIFLSSITFNNLSFSYRNQPGTLILRNLTFKISPNKCTAIVGGSGSGKSTIASLLLGLYPPSTLTSNVPDFNEPPTLTIFNHDIRTLHIPTLRNLVALVPQTPVLISDTVRNNILYGHADPTSHAGTLVMLDAAKSASIHDFILTLPQGYDTVIGDGAIGVSGGQAQRIAIARAFARDPRVLILDEATSALDIESAEAVRRGVRRLMRDALAKRHGLTVVVITHAREMMEWADDIVVLKDGSVVEQGPLRELLAAEGELWEMLCPGGEIGREESEA